MSQQVAQSAEARERANRPPRYPVHIGLRYRPVGERKWRQGKTDNFCRTGMMFWTDEIMEPDTHVEMTFQLPAYIEGNPGATVNCEGCIKRLAGSAGRISYAVAITKYKFVRGPKASRRKKRSSKKERKAPVNYL